jgi:hypothetical protein
MENVENTCIIGTKAWANLFSLVIATDVYMDLFLQIGLFNFAQKITYTIRI